MNKAQIAVNILLEDEPLAIVRPVQPEQRGVIRVCSMCEQEKGRAVLGPGQKPSHGLCHRHYRETAQEYGISPENIEATIQREIAQNLPPMWHDSHQ